MTHTTQRHSGTLGIAVVALVAIATALSAAAPADTPAFITGEALQGFLPSPEGWTKVGGRVAEVSISEKAGYAYADAVFTRDAMRVRVTVADTDGAGESLAAIATMVVTLPEDFTQTLKPATTITRSQYKTWPAAERWDSIQLKGDLTVVVGGRFVVIIEGQAIDAPQTLFAMIEPIDVATLATLK
jgi:hypothetical protein